MSESSGAAVANLGSSGLCVCVCACVMGKGGTAGREAKSQHCPLKRRERKKKVLHAQVTFNVFFMHPMIAPWQK